MKISILLTKEPYGVINAAEAVRHALGAVGFDVEASLLLMDGGVLLAAIGQEEAGTGFMNLGESLQDCIEMGVPVFADSDSLERMCLKDTDLVHGVEIVEHLRFAEIIKNTDQTLIY